MGFMMVLGNCYACGIIFSFNADWVPSIRIEGVREPLCRDCMNRVNRLRADNGVDAIYIHPDAYEPQEVT